jgi:FtsP/CotA-like multicopper oxidase with cupredoxin domain
MRCLCRLILFAFGFVGSETALEGIGYLLLPRPFNLIAHLAAEPLHRPSICSALEAGSSEVHSPFCDVTPLQGRPGQHEVTLSLSATTSPAYIGGYRLLETDNYNGGYIPPVVEVKPGDVLKVRLLNALAPHKSPTAEHDSVGHGHEEKNTNLHTHGLIVSPKNARPDLRQNGDNIFVNLGRGQSLDYNIEIPTALPASLLDGKSGIIPHPSGPFWYHSHLHGTSAEQVTGGMSGLLSIGAPNVNLVATIEAETAALRARTATAYLILRDIQITSTTDPTAADGDTPATWIKNPDTMLCQPDLDNVVLPPADKRDGYCQDPKDKNRIWLFTVNGQRFPTIRIPSGRNNLLRLANVSASTTYVISLRDPSGTAVKFDLISIDGVVPGTPKDASVQQSDSPDAIKASTLLLMPAARAEIFIGNDNGETVERRLVLRTDGLDTSAPNTTGGDRWPEVKLAEIVLEGAPVVISSATRLGLNQYTSTAGPTPARAGAEAAPALPPGCVRDINRTELEHRRIMFAGGGPWLITTEIVHPRDKTKPQRFDEFDSDPTASLNFIGFDQYLKDDGTVDWEGTGDGNDQRVRPRHTCVRLSNGHGQLWELNNPTATLHNFHLHQTKFRLAKEQDLRDYGIDPSSVSLKSGLQVKTASLDNSALDRDVWHDTLPIFPNETIFIIINFDAEEQIGRYVYHCHILAHEDQGLMAPIEVIP